MKERTTAITHDGQVTIPEEVRRALDLNDGDLVSWIIEDGHVELRKGDSVVARTAGAVRSHRPPMTAEEERELIERIIAEEAVRRGMD